MFSQRNTWFILLLQKCPLTFREIQMVYKQCYLPTVSYPLPATHIPDKLYDLQGPAMAVFLTKMGYPRTFPWAIVYAPSICGGIGLQHLGHEQGVQKCLQIIKHIHTNTSMVKVYSTLMEHNQLMAGLVHSILEDTQLIPWSTACWIDTLCQFLQHANSKILLANPLHPTQCWQDDHHIMDDVLGLGLAATHMHYIQSIHP